MDGLRGIRTRMYRIERIQIFLTGAQLRENLVRRHGLISDPVGVCCRGCVLQLLQDASAVSNVAEADLRVSIPDDSSREFCWSPDLLGRRFSCTVCTIIKKPFQALANFSLWHHEGSGGLMRDHDWHGILYTIIAIL